MNKIKVRGVAQSPRIRKRLSQTECFEATEREAEKPPVAKEKVMWRQSVTCSEWNEEDWKIYSRLSPI